jgi:hypothetical protein
MSLERIEEEAGQAILNVLHCYAWSYDANDMAQLASVFAEDAMTAGVVTGSDVAWGPWTGAAEIATKLGVIRDSQSDRRRHQLTTPVFLKLTDSEAVVKVYLSLFATVTNGKPRLATTGQYIATLSRSTGDWKIGRLEAQLDGNF